MKAITLTDKQYEKLQDVLSDYADEGWDSLELEELREVVENCVRWDKVDETKN